MSKWWAWLGLSVLMALFGCSAKDAYRATQDMACQQYYATEDPQHETECVKESYEDYQRSRESLQAPSP